MSDTTAAPELTYTSDEMMTVAAARELADGAVCFVGIGLPSTAANLARATHAPDVVLIYESGCIGAKPDRLPPSIGDGVLSATADAVFTAFIVRPTASDGRPRSPATAPVRPRVWGRGACSRCRTRAT